MTNLLTTTKCNLSAYTTSMLDSLCPYQTLIKEEIYGRNHTTLLCRREEHWNLI